MRTRLSGKFSLLFLTFAVLLAIPAIALADIIVADGDFVTTGNQAGTSANPIDIGKVKPGGSVTKQVSFQLVCDGNKHVDKGQTINLDATPGTNGVPSGGTLTATAATIGPVPEDWPDDSGTNTSCATPPQTLEDNGNTTVTFKAPSTAANGDVYNFDVSWRNSDVTLTPGGTQDSSAITGQTQVFFKVTVDNVPPPPPAITSPQNGSIDADGDFTVSGTAEAGSTVELFDGPPVAANSKGTTQADASGSWSKSLTGVADGGHPYQATATDAAGNTSPASPPVLVTVQRQQATNLSVASASGTYGGTTTLTATLTKTSDGSGVNDKTITFSLRGTEVCDNLVNDATKPDCPKTNTSGVATLNNVSISSIDAGGPTGTGYENAVSANFAGDSGFKASSGTANLTVNKANQTITFNQPTSPQTFGATFNVNPTSDSGLAVSVQASGGCSIKAAQVSGYDVTMTSGTNACVLTASQNGNPNYNAATDVTRTVAAQKANQTITFNALSSKTYGDAPFTLSANGGASGNPVTFALGTDSKGCSLSGTNNETVTITGATGVGEKCIIVASQAGNANYLEAASVTRDFNIAKAQATLTLSGLTGLTYNGTPQGATVTTTVNNSPVNLSGVSVTYDGSTTVPTDAGSYAVVASLDNPNYQATSALGTLVIDKVELTVKADNQSKTYDGNAFTAFTSQITGFVNNETTSVISGLPVTYNGTAVGAVDAGQYTITPVVSGLSATNYTFKAANGTLTIGERSVTASITAADKPYDGNDNATITGCSLDAASGNAGALANDDVDCSASNGHFDSASAGNKTVTATVELTGSAKNNYKLTSNTASTSAEIDKVELTVTADNKSKTFDTNPFTAFTSQITGFVNNETTSVISGLPVTYNGTAVGAVDAGQYTITPVVSGLSATNYTFKAANGTLTIGKAQGSVSINNPPANAVLNGSFTPSYTKAGDGQTSVSSLTPATCTVNSGVVSFVGAGVCTLQASVAEGTNHFAATGSQQSFNVGYKFVGFAAPVDNLSYMNVLKAGQAIPLKWRLLDANDQPVANLAGVTVTVKTLSCTQGATLDQLEEVAAGGSGLQNLGSGYYQYNWKSPTSYANSCKTLHLDLGEGKDASGNPVTRQAAFKFTK